VKNFIPSVLGIDAGCDNRHIAHAEHILHHPGIRLRDPDDSLHLAADLTFVSFHAVGLHLEIESADRVGRLFHMAPPDHGFDVVLKKNATLQRRAVRRGG
jgi:hypothetical protein